MDFYEVIETRRSIRKFCHDPIPEEKIVKILEAANLAPTAGNSQPWEFIVVSRSVLDHLKEISERAFQESAEEIGWAKWDDKLRDLMRNWFLASPFWPHRHSA